MPFVALKTLSGFNFVQADHVVAVQTSAAGGSVVVMANGVLVQSAESSKDIAQRLDAATLEASAAAVAKSKNEV